MESCKNGHFFPLTSLQIGDLQSYLSRLTLFLAPESKKFLILVDYRPWLMDGDARSARLWQLMVTKSRLSPFANTRAKRERKDFRKLFDLKNGDTSNSSQPKKPSKWFSLIDTALCQKRAMLPVKKLKDSFLLNSDLHHTLYGFIVFEVSWAHVRGISYLNELQTDTSMALEVKLMKRWEFDSIQQASRCISSWYFGTCHERLLLQEYLNRASIRGEEFYDAQEDTSATDFSGDCEYKSDNEEFIECRSQHGGASGSFSSPGIEYEASPIHTPPPSSGSYKRRKIMKSMFTCSEVDEVSEEAYGEIVSSPGQSVASTSTTSSDSEGEAVIFEATHYRDVMMLFRFNDHDLPFKLKEIIMVDIRLLTLLEYGLPSWVIFLQSYPVFCHFYRPWMCPLARALYVLISVVTVLIGFYDLYKNVPILKATASRLCGPFFAWIETWEMISRIKYLGTMLFIHNIEISVKWFLMSTSTIRSLLSVLTKPLAGPLMELWEFLFPIWNVCLEMVGLLCSVIWTVTGSTGSIVVSLLEIIIWPFWFILHVMWSIATMVIYPIFWILWEVLISPIQLVFASIKFILLICSYASYSMREVWSSIASILQLSSASGVTVGTSEVSIWGSLWSDLFSQVFRAIRSILYGFIAFCATCNRHRLSIYNHLQEFFRHLSCARGRSMFVDRSHLSRKHQALSPLADKGRSHGKHSRQSKEKAH